MKLPSMAGLGIGLSLGLLVGGTELARSGGDDVTYFAVVKNHVFGG